MALQHYTMYFIKH